MKKLTTFAIITFLYVSTLFAQEQQVSFFRDWGIEINSGCVEFSHDSKYLLSSFGTMNIYSVNLENGIVVKEYDASLFDIDGVDLLDDIIYDIEYSDDGKYLFVASYAGTLSLRKTDFLFVFDAYNKRLLYTKKLQTKRKPTFRNFFTFNTSSNLLAVVLENDTPDDNTYDITVCSLDNGEIIYSIDTDHTYGCFNLDFSPDGTFLCAILGTENYSFTFENLMWETASGNLIKNFGMTGGIYFSPDTKYYYHDGRMYSMQNHRLIKTMPTQFIDRVSEQFMDKPLILEDHYFFDGIDKWTIDGNYIGSIKTSKQDVLDYDVKYNETVPYACAVSPAGNFIAWNRKNGSVVIDKLEFTTKKNDTTPPVATVMVFEDDEWITITPDGYYVSSVNGDEYFNIRYDSDVFAIKQLARSYNRPDVIVSRFNNDNESPYVAYFGNIIYASPPPVIYLSMQNGLSTSWLTVEVMDDFSRFPLQDISISLNGKIICKYDFSLTQKNREDNVSQLLNAGETRQSMKFRVPINLEEKMNVIEVKAGNEACYGIEKLEINHTNILGAK